MAYSTESDIIKRLPESDLQKLTDDDNSGIVDSSVVSECIEQADGMIDGSLARYYKLPLSSTPALVKKLSCDIAIYLFFQRKTNEVPPAWNAAYNMAMTTLKEIAKGNIILSVDTVIETDTSSVSTGTVVTQYWSDDKRETENFFDY